MRDLGVQTEPEGDGRPSLGRGARLCRALAWTYVPQLLALVLSPVTECSHCVATFWTVFVILPGFIPLLMFPLPSALRFVCAGAMAVGLIWAHDALRHRTGVALGGRLALAALTALNAIAFGNVIRM